MRKWVVLKWISFFFFLLFSTALAEPYTSEDFPPEEVIAHNYSRLRGNLGFEYQKTIKIEKAAGNWTHIHFSYNRRTPFGDRPSSDVISIKKGHDDTWMMRGSHFQDEILQAIE